jgi:hypothetical protein
MVQAGINHHDLLCDIVELADASLRWALQELIDWEPG